MDSHIDFGKVMKQYDDCKYCGDGIPKKQMDEHVEWCKPMIEKGKALIEIKDIVTKLVNNYEHGYEYTKNCRDLLEALTTYNKSIKVKLE